MRMWTVAGTVAIGLAFAGLTALPGWGATPESPPPAAKAPAKVAPKPDKPEPKRTLADYRKDPMQVVIVSDMHGDCLASCARWIAAQGTLVEGTPAAFAKVLKQIGKEKLPVVITSVGGNVDASLAVGRMLRKAGLEASIGLTVFDGCAPTDDKCAKAKDFKGYRGRIATIGSYCASACPFLIAGAVGRYVSPFSMLGVHQITNVRQNVQQEFRVYYRMEGDQKVEVRRELVSQRPLPLKIETAGAKDPIMRNVRKYLTEMGISDTLLALADTAPRDQMHWMTPEERLSTGLVTHAAPAIVLISRPAPSAAVVAVRGAGAPAMRLAIVADPVAVPLPVLQEAAGADPIASPVAADAPRATLYVAPPGKGWSQYDGTVSCAIVDEAGAAGGGTTPVFKAHAEIARRGLVIDVEMRANSDASFAASHVVDVILTSGGSVEDRPVASLTGLFAYTERFPIGSRLAASTARITDKLFMAALVARDPERAQNIDMLKVHKKIGISLDLEGDLKAIVELSCGSEGREALADFLTGDTGTVAATP